MGCEGAIAAIVERWLVDAKIEQSGEVISDISDSRQVSQNAHTRRQELEK